MQVKAITICVALSLLALARAAPAKRSTLSKGSEVYPPIPSRYLPHEDNLLPDLDDLPGLGGVTDDLDVDDLDVDDLDVDDLDVDDLDVDDLDVDDLDVDDLDVDDLDVDDLDVDDVTDKVDVDDVTDKVDVDDITDKVDVDDVKDKVKGDGGALGGGLPVDALGKGGLPGLGSLDVPVVG